MLRLALLLCAGFVGWAAIVAHGQTLTFQSQDVPAASKLLADWKAQSPTGWWTWSITGWDQNEDGKTDLYVNTHSRWGGTLLRQGATLDEWKDVTGELGQTPAAMPTENRPIFFDINADGHVDIVATGDENKNTSRLNRVDSLEASPVRFVVWRGVVSDLNGDGLIDCDV